MNQRDQALEYRGAFKRLYKVALIGSVVAIAIIIRLHIGRFPDDTNLVMGFRILVACSLPLSIIIRLWFFVRPRLFSKYWLEEHRLLIEQGRKKFEMKFTEIKRIVISRISPRFLGGFRVEMNSGMKIRFPSALAGNYMVLEAIANARPDMVPDKIMDRYRQMSRQVDASWKRMGRKLRNLPMMAVKYFVFPGLLIMAWYKKYPSPSGAPVFDRALLVVGGHVLGLYILAFVINHLEERMFHFLYELTLRKRDSFLRNVKWEKYLEWGAQVVFYFLAVFFYRLVY
ncbi:MAG: hypothetical protein H6624_15090 [Bdellovibrionaceae bacterium]|nr:hypothetical protein [Bdellovibrionales bacterium]MCB9085670.1 hypothetical protein [Pseudobdellovibrionaceae bacterium]